VPECSHDLIGLQQLMYIVHFIHDYNAALLHQVTYYLESILLGRKFSKVIMKL